MTRLRRDLLAIAFPNQPRIRTAFEEQDTAVSDNATRVAEVDEKADAATAAASTAQETAEQKQDAHDNLTAVSLLGPDPGAVEQVQDGLFAIRPIDSADTASLLSRGIADTRYASANTVGLTDGDKGDIVVSSGGTVMTFDSGVVTAFSRTVLDDANAAAWQGTLGLVPGTNIQAWDTMLESISALTDPNADRIAFWDDSANAWTWLQLGTGLAIIGTTISASGVTGATLADGDYGDVTASSSGTVITIDNDVVSFAKMADLATDRLIGRDTAGTGDPEAISLTGGLEFTGSTSIQVGAFTGDATKTAGGTVLTLATVNSNTGTYGGATTSAQISVNGKGLITGVSAITITPAWTSITSTPTTLAGYSITGTKANFNTACTDGDFVFTDAIGVTVQAYDATVRVPETRTISTTAPLTGGGDLSANRTFAITAASGAAAGSMSAADFTKLAGIATGATANSSDATLLARANHTGTQAHTTITGLGTAATADTGITGHVVPFLDAASLTWGGNQQIEGDVDIELDLTVEGNLTVGGTVNGGTLSGSNTGDQTSIVGITGTKAQFSTAVTDGDILFVGDVTDEMAQDAVGGILVDTATIDLTYSDATPSITAAVIDDSITNAKLANMAQATIKGRAAGAGTGDPTDLTASQAKTALAIVAADVSDFSTAADARVAAAVDVSVQAHNAFLDHIATIGFPGGDRILFFDDSESGITTLEVGSGLNITGTILSASEGTATLADGDYGDVIASADGTVITIDDGAVTLAKQANVSTGTLFYRKTAGSGAPEIQTLATLKTDLGLTGTNSGDQTITLTGDATGSGTGSFATTLATVNSNVGSFGSATQAGTFTVNAKGLTIAASNVTITPAVGSITGLGTGVATALAVNIGSAGAFVTFNGAGGTPTSLTLTNATGLPTAGLVNDAVTYAKMQNVSATDRLLGRSTAGAGDVEEITCTAAGRALIDDADATAQRATLSAVGLTGNETVAGVKTFSSNPIVSGGGVAFPATQVASADPNTLDDYEEGTFTPGLTFGGGATGMSGTFSGRYTKIGRQVTIQILITLTAKGSSTGAALITALPFTAAASPYSCAPWLGGNLTTVAVPMSFVNASTTTIVLQDFTGSTRVAMTDADFTNTSEIFLSTTYFV